jgi:hypothetical protein
LETRGAALRTALDEHPELPSGVASTLRQFLVAVTPVCQAKDAASVMVALLKHHERVQSGKIDPSRQPKQPWVELRPREVLVSPRFALETLPAPRATGAFTHPYRVESFASMITELDGWRTA